MSASKREHMDVRASEQQEYTPQGTKETGLVLSQNTLLGATKSDLTAINQQIVQSVAEGFGDAMEALVIGKKLEAMGKELVENVKGYAFGKTYATKAAPLLKYGCKITASETGTEYDWESTKDEQLLQWIKDVESLTEKVKARKDLLKNLKGENGSRGKMTLLDEDTGEVKTIYEPVKSCTNGYTISINK